MLSRRKDNKHFVIFKKRSGICLFMNIMDKEQKSSGPNFEDNGGWGEKLNNFFKNNFSYILLIVALIIIVGGIFLYFHKHANVGTANITNNAENTAVATNSSTAATTVATSSYGSTDLNPNQISNQVNTYKQDNGTVVSNDKITLQAAKGDSISSLALKASETYESQHNVSVSAEREIYIQDYMQKNTGTYLLAQGQEIAFSNSLMQQAIQASSKLTPAQLKNLDKYVELVPQLSKK